MNNFNVRRQIANRKYMIIEKCDHKVIFTIKNTKICGMKFVNVRGTGLPKFFVRKKIVRAL